MPRRCSNNFVGASIIKGSSFQPRPEAEEFSLSAQFRRKNFLNFIELDTKWKQYSNSFEFMHEALRGGANVAKT